MAKREEDKTKLRDYVESLAVAVIMALTLKYFIVEAFKIPTWSMQPTLIGSPEAGIHDRILVDKLSYRFRDPKRWEVVVFHYPLDQSKNFVKRVVGLPGEELRIEFGDLWTRGGPGEEWSILRRPRTVQLSTWKRLGRLVPDYTEWHAVSGADGWQHDGRDVLARGDGKVRFGQMNGPITDRYSHGYPDGMLEIMNRNGRVLQAHHVGDLRVTGDVRALPGCERVQVQLYEGLHRYVFELPGPAAPEDSRPSLTVWLDRTGAPSEELAKLSAEPERLEPGRRVAFDVQNLDDLLEFRLDGELILELEVEPARTDRDRASAAHLAVEGEGADLLDLMAYRDIYYLPQKTGETPIPEGHYFMMGDNTQDSSDSREWTQVTYTLRDEPSGTRTLRGNYRTGSYQDGANPLKLPGGPDGTEVWFQNVWGERTRFLDRDTIDWKTEPAPFVPRELIHGRAIAVFWPFVPRLGVYRLKWVR